MFTAIKKYWKSLPAGIQIAIIGLVAFGLYMGFRAVLKKYKANSQQKIKENSNATGTVTGSNGQSVPVTVNLGTAATNIHAAFHDNDWFGMTEDEQKAMTELTNIPKNLISNLSAVYYQLYSANLKEEFQKYLSDSQYNSISSYFN